MDIIFTPETDMSDPEQLSGLEHVQLEATINVLDRITSNAIANHGANPMTTLHAPAQHSITHLPFGLLSARILGDARSKMAHGQICHRQIHR